MLLEISGEKSMVNRTRKSVWDPQTGLSKLEMDARIKNALSSPGWQEAVMIINNKGIPIDQLHIAEVGCGTGTLGLTFGLLGAAVTLIDFNEKALERAGNIYKMYDCQAGFVNADFLDAPSGAIKGSFDVVISGGLLDMLARKTGFASAYVIPNSDGWKDFQYYARGFISAFTDLFPKKLKDGLKKYSDNFHKHAAQPLNKDEDMRAYCVNKSGLLKKDLRRQPAKVRLFDRLSSGLVLFAFQGREKTDVG